MIDAEQSDRLLRFFENMLSFYRDFLAFEREKHGVILAGDFAKLDAALKKEQAFTLKARGMENDRTKLLREIGAEGGTFRELIPQIEPARQDEMRRLYEGISAAVGDIRRINERSERVIRVNLGRISKTLSALEGNPELKQIYRNDLKSEPGAENTFSKKI
jgi:hypothetical protein